MFQQVIDLDVVQQLQLFQFLFFGAVQVDGVSAVIVPYVGEAGQIAFFRLQLFGKQLDILINKLVNLLAAPVLNRVGLCMP